MIRCHWLLLLPALALPAAADTWDAALRRAEGLQMLNRLAFTADQLTQMAPLAERLHKAAALAPPEPTNAEVLQKLRTALLEGEQAASEQWQPYEQAVQERANFEQKQADELADIMSEVRKLLTPRQLAQIDWHNPRQGAQERAAERQAKMRQAALLVHAAQFLDQIRYLDAYRFVTERLRRVDDFLRPLVGVASPRFAAYRQFLINLTDQVRMVPEAQWPQQRRRFAGQVLQGLGLETAGGSAPAKKYTQAQLRDFLTSPDADDLLRKMASGLKAKETSTAEKDVAQP